MLVLFVVCDNFFYKNLTFLMLIVNHDAVKIKKNSALLRRCILHQTAVCVRTQRCWKQCTLSGMSHILQMLQHPLCLQHSHRSGVFSLAVMIVSCVSWNNASAALAALVPNMGSHQIANPDPNVNPLYLIGQIWCRWYWCGRCSVSRHRCQSLNELLVWNRNLQTT